MAYPTELTNVELKPSDSRNLLVFGSVFHRERAVRAKEDRKL